jgi:hypothetical protein
MKELYALLDEHVAGYVAGRCKEARVLDLKGATQMFALAKFLAEFGV